MSNLAQECPLRTSNTVTPSPRKQLPTGKARIKLLYEEYIHLPQLQRVWATPLTANAVLEPLFSAALHSIELSFLLLAEFLNDSRSYVSKRPRVERVTDDLTAQCKLITEIVDGELEEESSTATANRLSLTQQFPFPGAPPTAGKAGHSPGIARLIAAAHASNDRSSQAEKNSLIKTVINLTTAFFGSFQRWTVGVGLEPQLNELRSAVGLPPLPFTHTVFLDYNALVRPQVAEETLTKERYTYAEDFFFRTVHLGTECWAFIAVARLKSAGELAETGHFHVAAARTQQAARILDYLGDHVMLLTQMNLHDYLHLKVELEGTSGEGSAAVKQLRPLIKALIEPLAEAALGAVGETAVVVDVINDEDERLGRALMKVYRSPDAYSQLYNYAKGLEDIESSLAHFYYQHFCLAQNVIGSDARGTMRLPVQALKRTYETGVFPVLDRVRSGLGAAVDSERAHIKGKMMDEIIHNYLTSQEPNEEVVQAHAAVLAERLPSTSLSGCPFGFGNASHSTNAATETRETSICPAQGNSHTTNRATTATTNGKNQGESTTSSALSKLYSWSPVPQVVSAALRRHAAALHLPSHHLRPLGGPLTFLDHAWGQPSSQALRSAMVDVEGLYHLGNPSWDVLYGQIIPEASKHVLDLLKIPSEGVASVHFGSNSHELVTRILSQLLLDGNTRENKDPLRVLTSDCEFYSVTRQLNRLAEAGVVEVVAVPAEPAETFAERFLAVFDNGKTKGPPFDVVYVSQVTYLTQQTLLPDVATVVAALHHQENESIEPPLIIIDGYHAFTAFSVDLGTSADKFIYIAGLLKHAGCGANAAFATVPCRMLNDTNSSSSSSTPIANSKSNIFILRPALTGWLADPSVLSAGSEGITHGSAVDYFPSLALQGGTPGHFLPLLTFNHLQRLWKESGEHLITVQGIHDHVLALQDEFLVGLPEHGPRGLTLETLVLPSAPECRSHTLVFNQSTPRDAKEVVETLQSRGVVIDSRKEFVRVGFGPNHTSADVHALLVAIKSSSSSSK